MLMLLIFIIGSAVIVYVPRVSLLAPRSHGFYRFIRHPLYSSLLFWA